MRERAIAAAGMVKAAELLAGEFTLVITNVPYLGRGKQDDLLKAHLEKHFDEGKGDLATAFALRCVEFCSHGGGVALVVPWGWTFATTYQPFRERILKSWLNILAKLGEGGFASAAAAGAFVVAPILTRNRPPETQLFAAVDASRAQILEEKSGLLTSGHIVLLSQMRQFDNPDSRILFGISVDMELLSERARSYQGIKTGDDGRGKAAIGGSSLEKRLVGGGSRALWTGPLNMAAANMCCDGRMEVPALLASRVRRLGGSLGWLLASCVRFAAASTLARYSTVMSPRLCWKMRSWLARCGPTARARISIET